MVRHYPVARTQKAADWSQLLLVCAVLGGPRVVQSMNLNPTAAQAPPRPAAQAPPVTAPQVPTAAPPLPPGSLAPGAIVTPGMLDPGSMAGSHMTSGRA